jgi:hypothetical protein
MYYPAIIFAAGAIGLIFADILNKHTKSIAGHAFFGILLVIVSVVLSQNGADLVAWGLLVLPMVILFLSFIIVVFKGPWGKSPHASLAAPATAPAGGSQMQLSCSVQTPSSSCNTVPTPLAQAPGVIQGTIASTSTQPAALTNLSQPLSAYVSRSSNTPAPLTPASSCTT